MILPKVRDPRFVTRRRGGTLTDPDHHLLALWAAGYRHDWRMTIAEVYRRFAVCEARGVSRSYERLSFAVADDDEILALLANLPAPKRQPNLLFAVVRLLGGPVEDPVAFRAYVLANWPQIGAEMRARATQTNEAGRCAVLLPVLAALPQPLALLEVGASANLCLYPDRYGYRYGMHVVDSGPPILDCELRGVAPPVRLPEVIWRAGLDLNPLDVSNPADVAWLDALIWPEHAHRRTRLRAAIAVAAADRHCWYAVTPWTIWRSWPPGRRPAPRWSCSTARCSTTYPRHDARSSARWFVGCRDTGSRTRARACSTTTGCPSRRALPHTTCSRWTAGRWAGPVRTGRPCTGSADPHTPRHDHANGRQAATLTILNCRDPRTPTSMAGGVP